MGIKNNMTIYKIYIYLNKKIEIIKINDFLKHII